MPFIPHSQSDIQQMLAQLGMSTLDDLFADIPADLLTKGLDLPPPAGNESELFAQLRAIAARNHSTSKLCCFLGAGAYEHYIPAVVDEISSRGEFLTAYTPYQPEISQGTLQAIFEYQSMICEVFGMDVSNASVYDGATALGEAALIACRTNPKATRLLVSAGLHPDSLKVLKTMLPELELVTADLDSATGATDLDQIATRLDENTAGVILQSPNFLGVIEDMEAAGKLIKDHKALFITSTNPVSLGLLKTPGECGADIAVGEGQVLGNPLNFGGPYLGIFTCTAKHMRKLPGRVVGKTRDSHGKTAYVMTLRAREQDIRREKATSNICTNQALMAMRACVYMSWLGKEGFAELARANYSLAHRLHDQLLQTGVFEKAYDAEFFNEFALRVVKGSVDDFCAFTQQKGLIAGYPLKKAGLMPDGLLIAVTETKNQDQLQRYVELAQEYTQSHG